MELASQHLKQETASAHRNIEGAFPVMRPDFSIEEYRGLLKKLYGFYKTLEDQMTVVFATSNVQFDYEPRKKIKLLEADLRSQGVTDEEIRAIKVYSPWLQNLSLTEALGILYVLEGSTLGGQFITKHLTSKFALTPVNGIAFFNAYGPQTGLMWKQFQSQLNAQLNDSEKIKSAVQAASATFENLGSWFKS